MYKASSPHRFYISLQKDVGIGLCKFTFTIISSLPCLHTFWHAIPTSFYIFNVYVLFLYFFDVNLIWLDLSLIFQNLKLWH